MTTTINPFVIIGHIPDQYFCDREAETRKLLLALTNQQNVVLSSPRRMGKTKLVDHVFNKSEIADHYITISLDILQTNSLSEFTFSLGNAVFNRVARRSERLLKLFPMILKSLNASFGYDPVSSLPTFNIKLGDITRPEYTLEEIFSFLDQADRRCLVVIDEFQQIVSYPEKNVEALLRSHIQQSRNANFVFCGSQRRIMNEMFGSAQRPFYNSATPLELGPIPLENYTAFAVEKFREGGKAIAADAVRLAYNTFRGVTLYDQLAMNNAYALTPLGETCDQTTIGHIIEDLVGQNDIRERELLQFLSEMQKAILYAIFEDEPVKGVTSAAFTKKHRLKSPSSTQAALKRLLELDLITKSDGLYSIADPMLDLWIERNIPSAIKRSATNDNPTTPKTT